MQYRISAFLHSLCFGTSRSNNLLTNIGDCITTIEDYQMNTHYFPLGWLVIRVSKVLLICQILCKIMASLSSFRSKCILCRFCCEYEESPGVLKFFQKECSAISFWEKSFMSGEERGCAINAFWNRSCDGDGVWFLVLTSLHGGANIFQHVLTTFEPLDHLSYNDDEECIPSFSISALTARHRSKLEKH